MGKSAAHRRTFFKGAAVVAALLLIAVVMLGCGKKTYTVGKNVSIDDITDFYYTYENINFNALSQRCHFYREDGKYLFYHEKREKPNQYGPLTEEDITESGTVELSAEQWNAFFDCIKDGTVIKREESAITGDSGPWYYLYWKNDKGEIQQYSFVSYERELEFKEFCESLKAQAGTP